MLERNLTLEEFPSPQELWQRYCAWKGWSDEVQRVAAFDYSPSKTPRYYQLNAINRTVEAIASGQNRALLVMATGTGEPHGVPDHLAPLENKTKQAHPLSGGPQHPDRPDHGQRLPPFKGAMAKLSPNAKGVERVDAQGRVTVEDVELAVNKSTKQVDKSYESTCLCTRPSPAAGKSATSTSSSARTSSTSSSWMSVTAAARPRTPAWRES